VRSLGDGTSSLGDAKSSLGDAKSSLDDAKSSLDDAKSSLGDAKSSLGDAKSSLDDAKSLLGDVKSSLGDGKSSLGDAKSSLGDANRSRTLRRAVDEGALQRQPLVIHVHVRSLQRQTVRRVGPCPLLPPPSCASSRASIAQSRNPLTEPLPLSRAGERRRASAGCVRDAAQHPEPRARHRGRVPRPVGAREGRGGRPVGSVSWLRCAVRHLRCAPSLPDPRERERVGLVGSHGRWKRPCLQTAHMTT
jgi:hypothetical protein